MDTANIKPDTPVSITDGAPSVIDCHGAACRIPSGMDYRIISRVVESGELTDEWDQAVLMLYCAMHTSPKQIKQLWQEARNPKKIAEKVIMWQATQNAESLTATINELLEYDKELSDETDDGEDPGESNGKKKTG